MTKSWRYAVISILCIIALSACSSNDDNSKESSNSKDNSSQSSQDVEFMWTQTGEGWQASGDAPECPEQPMLKTPADVSLATSVLYPGQTRGQYKPHGGLRFDNSDNFDIEVTSPLDGFVIKGSRFLVDGEIQYGFDIFNNCGVMTRLGHLRELSPVLQKIADDLPEASTDSRLENINPPVYVKAGDDLATAVGTTKDSNTFFDWGVYDYRQPNQASESAEYQAAHQMDKEMSFYAVCWFDWLPSDDAAVVKALPAGGGEAGAESDYC